MKTFFQEKLFTEATLALWTRHLGQMLEVGVSLVPALEALAVQHKAISGRKLLLAMAYLVSTGESFSHVLSRYPKFFDKLYVQSIKAGELSGELSTVLCRLADFLEQKVKTKNKIRSALLYPSIVGAFALLVVVLLVIVVIPRMETVFQDVLAGASLPLLTQWVLAGCHFFSSTLGWLGLMGVVFLFVIRQLMIRHRVAFLRDRLLLNVLGIGAFIQQINLGRFTYTLSLLLQSGIPLSQALEVSEEFLSNRKMKLDFARAKEQVLQGMSLSESLQFQQNLPPAFIQMISVGEQTGTLPVMLEKVAQQLDDQLNRSMTQAITWIEPLMILVLALVIGGVVVAFFLPMMSVLESLGGF